MSSRIRAVLFPGVRDNSRPPLACIRSNASRIARATLSGLSYFDRPTKGVARGAKLHGVRPFLVGALASINSTRYTGRSYRGPTSVDKWLTPSPRVMNPFSTWIPLIDLLLA